MDAIGGATATSESEIATKIRQQLTVLKQKVTETATELDKCRTEQEQFSVEYYSCRENSNRLQALQQQHAEQHPQVKAHKAQKETMEKGIKAKVKININVNYVIGKLLGYFSTFSTYNL